jgi:hypothetical protein
VILLLNRDMGAGQSGDTSTGSGGTEGYHVLRVQEDSPASRAGLEAFFDFIVAIGNNRLNRDNENLKEILRNHAEHPVTIQVYSSKTQELRDCSITPSALWGGQGLLGVSIRFCSFENANDNVWHVVEVQVNSPAALAGLQSEVDFIIGSDTLLHEPDDMYTLIESNDQKALNFFVYNTIGDSCREVVITPNSAWGGEGMLGCGLAHGYLHRIPLNRQFPSKLPASMETSSNMTGVGEPQLAASPAFSVVPTSIKSAAPVNPSSPADQSGSSQMQQHHQQQYFSQLPAIPTFPAPPNLASGTFNSFPNAQHPLDSSAAASQPTSSNAASGQHPSFPAMPPLQMPTSATGFPHFPSAPVTTSAGEFVPPPIDFSKLPPLNFPPTSGPHNMYQPPPMFQPLPAQSDNRQQQMPHPHGQFQQASYNQQMPGFPPSNQFPPSFAAAMPPHNTPGAHPSAYPQFHMPPTSSYPGYNPQQQQHQPPPQQRPPPQSGPQSTSGGDASSFVAVQS